MITCQDSLDNNEIMNPNYKPVVKVTTPTMIFITSQVQYPWLPTNQNPDLSPHAYMKKNYVSLGKTGQFNKY